MNHSNMFTMIGGELISTGFCAISCMGDGDIYYDAYGRSATLQVSSREYIDTKLMNRIFSEY